MKSHRLPRSLLAFLWLAATTLAPASAGDIDRDGLDDALEDALLYQYAPLVKLHPDEPNMPASVEWVFGFSTMTFKHADCAVPHSVIGGDRIDATRILNRFHPGGTTCAEVGPIAFSNEYVTEGRRDGFALEFHEDTIPGAPPEEWTTYGHVYPGRNGEIVLQYWFFFAYNDWMVFGRHQGDWEHISIVLDANQEPDRAYFSAHGDPNRVGWKFVEKEFGHPVVYTAAGSHASYKSRTGPACDVYRMNWGKIEKCSDDGEWWSTWSGFGGLINVGEKAFPRNGATWLQYTGLWGSIGANPNNQEFKSGPEGPAIQYEDWHRQGSEEICNNYADDDLDGTIDENSTCVSLPDLTLSEANPALATNAVPDRVTVDPGESFEIRCGVENHGIGFAEVFDVGFVLSTDRTLDVFDIPLLGYLSIEGMPATGSYPTTPTWTATVPALTPGGTYWLIAKVDQFGTVIEADELNNVRVSDIPIQVLASFEDQEKEALTGSGAPGVPLYRLKENFSDGVAQNFFPVWGAWDASPEAYFGTGEPFGMDDTMSLIASSTPSYTMAFLFGGVAAPSPHGIHVGAVLRYTWIDEFLRLEIRQPVGQPAIMELVNVEGTRSILASAPLEVNFYEGMHELRITDTGCHLTAELNGDVVLETDYSSNAGVLERGFYVNFDNTFLFDNLVLDALPEIDADGDGFTICGGDCDDSRSDVRPDAHEVCGNGRDDNCDDLIDEGCRGWSCQKNCPHEEVGEGDQ